MLSPEQQTRLNGATLRKRLPRKDPAECFAQLQLRVEEKGPGVYTVIAASGSGELYLTQNEIARIKPDAQGLVLLSS
jgi:hypothetical protein